MHPFRDFSASLYRKPGVADASLFVQDRYGLNINLILLCIWVAETGGGALTAGNIATALRRLADWEQHVIQPLREIRRACRHEALGIPEFLLQTFQPQIETVELGAEHVEQLVLAEFARGWTENDARFPVDESPDNSVGHSAGKPAGDAVCSLKAYIGELDIVPEAPLTECLSVILQAAFAGAYFPVDAADSEQPAS